MLKKKKNPYDHFVLSPPYNNVYMEYILLLHFIFYKNLIILRGSFELSILNKVKNIEKEIKIMWPDPT